MTSTWDWCFGPAACFAQAPSCRLSWLMKQLSTIQSVCIQTFIAKIRAVYAEGKLHLVIDVNRNWKNKWVWWHLKKQVSFWFGLYIYTTYTTIIPLHCQGAMWSQTSLVDAVLCAVLSGLMAAIVTHRVPSLPADKDLISCSSYVNSRSDKHPVALTWAIS